MLTQIMIPLWQGISRNKSNISNVIRDIMFFGTPNIDWENAHVRAARAQFSPNGRWRCASTDHRCRGILLPVQEAQGSEPAPASLCEGTESPLCAPSQGQGEAEDTER